ncbi:hypothetical protein [Paenibacillus phocaensis]|uniref:hypothetical protein n=1 Tax=Paenibacillus phocaensis TaxID=1776378 RepID=UPI000A7D5FBD|nr:hypothetical protein [Paenibacillus phocaensis]
MSTINGRALSLVTKITQPKAKSCFPLYGKRLFVSLRAQLSTHLLAIESPDAKYVEARVTAVNEIAGQIKLLSLNASIKAARAGDHGIINHHEALGLGCALFLCRPRQAGWQAEPLDFMLAFRLSFLYNSECCSVTLR